MKIEISVLKYYPRLGLSAMPAAFVNCDKKNLSGEYLESVKRMKLHTRVSQNIFQSMKLDTLIRFKSP